MTAATRVRRTALVVAQYTPLRQSLGIVLETLREVETVVLVGDISEAMDAVAEHDPCLVMMQAASPNAEILDALVSIRARWPRRCLVFLASDHEQRCAAMAAGADAAFVLGLPPARLIESLGRLLAQARGKDPPSTGAAGTTPKLPNKMRGFDRTDEPEGTRRI